MELSSGVRLYADPDSLNYTFHGLDYSRKPDKLEKGIQKLEEHAKTLEAMGAAALKISRSAGPAIAEAAASLRALKEAITAVLACKLSLDKSAGVAIQKPDDVFQRAINAYKAIQTAGKEAPGKEWAVIHKEIPKRIEEVKEFLSRAAVQRTIGIMDASFVEPQYNEEKQ